MRIVSYNINDCNPRKIEHLLGLHADVLVVPEITCPENSHLPERYEMEWCGIDYFFHEKRWKGLGIIWKKGSGFIPEWFNPEYSYAIPLIVGEYLILGIWPTKTTANEPQSYPQIAQEIIREYAPHFKDFKTLVVGDFNCYVKQYDATKQYGDILRVNELLESFGLHSLYHQQTGEEFGHESVATYYHRFNEKAPFFLDYAYSNFPVASFSIFPWDKEMSDHVGMEVITD